MRRSLQTLTTAELEQGLEDIRGALARIGTNGVIQYTINGRSGQYSLEALVQWEADFETELLGRQNKPRRSRQRLRQPFILDRR